MNMLKIVKKINSICLFEKLKTESDKYIKDDGYLISEDMIFLVYLPATDYYYLPYFQIYNYKNVVVDFSYINSDQFITKFYKSSIRNIAYWNYTRVKYDKKKQYYLFFDGQYTLASRNFRLYLQEKYPGCKIIFHLGDLISTKKGIDIRDIKDFADLVVTYDHNDADVNGLRYHPDPYSQLCTEMLESNYPKSHLIFYGYAKNRVEDLLGVYDKMNGCGVDCDFSIPDLTNEQCEKRPELANAQFTPYIEYLKRVQSSDCILEIIQKGSRGCTFRTWEAITYNKKLITNNPSVRDEEFYNPQFIQVIDSIESLDVDWLKQDVKVDYGYAENLAPNACFEYYLNSLNTL